jgi:putative FmdB family regulatory protein
MPIYEYTCKKCGEFEVMQRITEPSLRKCPTCKGKVERLLSRSSFVLKGSGWYATDYARKGTGSAESKETTPAAATASSESNGSSAKTEAPAKPASTVKSTPAKSAD